MPPSLSTSAPSGSAAIPGGYLRAPLDLKLNVGLGVQAVANIGPGSALTVESVTTFCAPR